MAVPNFLRSSYYFHEAFAVANFDLVLDEIYTALTGQSPAWTLTDNRAANPANVVCKSPVDADGRFFTATFTVVTGSTNLKLEMVLTDQNGTTVCTRRVGAAAAGSWDILIYSGEYHFYMDIYYQVAAPEFMMAGMTDHTPEAQTVNSHYVYGGSAKTSGDSLSGNTPDYASMIDNATATHSSRCDCGQAGATAREGDMTEGGFRRFVDRQIWCRPTGENTFYSWAGRGYQQILVGAVSSGGVAPRAEITVPIDVGTTGVFKVCGGSLVFDNKYIAYRIA